VASAQARSPEQLQSASRHDPFAEIVETNHAKAKHWVAVVACAVAIAVAAGGCERPAAPGQLATRAPDVPYEPTPHHVVAEMLKLAQVGANDVVYDLGCGDGRIVIAAVKEFGARGVCVDIDPQRIRESRANAENAGVVERTLFLNQDLFDTDIRDATVVTLFLSPSVNLKLRPKLWRELKAGTRVVSYMHSMGEWTPQQALTVESGSGPRKLFLWIVPADVEDKANDASK
jgi:precorrin-6B methylase 2